MRGSRRLAVVVLLALAGPTPLMAQESASIVPSPWHVGGSLGVAGSGTEFAPIELFTVNVHASKARPAGVGVDLAVGTLPRLILDGVLPFGARVGATTRIGSANAAFWPSAGITMAGVVGEDGADGITGGYLGSAVTLFGDDASSGLRIDWTLHRFDGSTVWLLELGFVRRR